jgi:hypothetical protein
MEPWRPRRGSLVNRSGVAAAPENRQSIVVIILGGDTRLEPLPDELTASPGARAFPPDFHPLEKTKNISCVFRVFCGDQLREQNPLVQSARRIHL